MMRREKFAIANIYVPIKRRATLKLETVQEIAQSMLEVGQQVPILVRRDGDSICEWRSVAHPPAQRTVLQLCFSSSGGLVSSVGGSASARLALRNAVFSSLFRCFSSLRARAALARSARSRP